MKSSVWYIQLLCVIVLSGIVMKFIENMFLNVPYLNDYAVSTAFLCMAYAALEISKKDYNG